MKWSYFKIFQNERSLKSIIEFENVDVICHRWCHYFDKLWVKERDVLGLPCRRNTHEVLTTGHYAAIRLYSASQWNLQYNVTNEPNFVLRANLSKRTVFRKTDCFFQNAAAHVRKNSPFSEKQSVWSGYITNEFVVITWACGGARWNLTDHGCAWRSVDLSAFVVRIVVKASTSSSFDQNILSIDFVVIWVCVIETYWIMAHVRVGGSLLWECFLYWLQSNHAVHIYWSFWKLWECFLYWLQWNHAVHICWEFCKPVKYTFSAFCVDFEIVRMWEYLAVLHIPVHIPVKCKHWWQIVVSRSTVTLLPEHLQQIEMCYMCTIFAEITKHFSSNWS